MSDTENQMGLFETGEALPEKSPAAPMPAMPPTQPEPRPRPAAKPAQRPAAVPRRERAEKKPAPRGVQAKKAAKAVSGLVPEGDVRLTANIRQDLHLKLKIASAYRRTTIGEIIEELVERYV